MSDLKVHKFGGSSLADADLRAAVDALDGGRLALRAGPDRPAEPDGTDRSDVEPIVVRAIEKLAPSFPKISRMTWRLASGSRCASTKADDSVNEVPIPLRVCLITCGCTWITFAASGSPAWKWIGFCPAIRSPASDVSRTSTEDVRP